MCKPVPEGSELEDSDDDMLNEVDTKWERSITMPPAIGMAWVARPPKLSLRPSNGELPSKSSKSSRKIASLSCWGR